MFVVTSEIKERLSHMLKPVLAYAQQLVGDEWAITVVFDGGGWSPQLFVRLVEAGCDLITFRKGKTDDQAVEAFTPATLTIQGTTAEQVLHDHDEAKLRRATGPRLPFLMREAPSSQAAGTRPGC